jgi:hypothetical protein
LSGAGNLDFIVQAANGVGLVSMDDNFGEYFSLTTTGDEAPTTLTLQPSNPSTGVFGSTVSLGATLTSGGSPVADGMVVFSIGGAARVGTTGGNGVVTVELPLNGLPAEYRLSASFVGSDDLASSADEQAFEIRKAATTLSIAPVEGATQRLGEPSGVTATVRDSSGATLKERTVYFVVRDLAEQGVTVPVITDFAGVARLPALDLPDGGYTVRAHFLGTIPGVGTLDDPTYRPADPVATTLTIVSDETPPVVTTPADYSIEATGPDGAVVTFAATAVDDVDGPVPVACIPVSGTAFPLGATTVTCSATDFAGNTGSADFTVTVVDTTAPVVQPLADLTIEATGPDGATAEYATSADDLVDGAVAVECTSATGSTFTLGETAVECTATDGAGNIGSTGFVVTVVDTTEPSVTGPGNLTVRVPTADTPIEFATSANDLVDGAISPVCTPPSGSIFELWVVTPVTCGATDSAGNTGSVTFTITAKLDTDWDGLTNDVDPDDDNDLQLDEHEIACGSDPLDAASVSPDLDGDSIPDCVDTATDVYGVTQRLIIDLRDLSDRAADRNDGRAIDAAIRQLEMSLNQQYWSDDLATLDPQDGDRVFDRFADAAAELKKVNADGLLPEVYEIIDTLTILAERLALETIALLPPGHPALDSVRQDLDKAATDLARGDHENAIRDYRNAWRTAQDALLQL